MSSWIAWIIALISTTAFVVLWFREVRYVLTKRKSTVESAAGHLAVCREKVSSGPADPDAAAVLARSESIYRQAVTLYNDAVWKPWNSLPAMLMGFKEIPTEKRA